jgi:uncharacterized ferritin-like protein (DUF455 family)
MIIYRDEIGHVAIGNAWYKRLCDEQGLDVIATYARLATQYAAPKLRGLSIWKPDAAPVLMKMS